MKILFITRHNWPHVGGVEKHVFEITKILKQKGHKVTVISSDGNEDYNIKYPKIKFFGLFKIWFDLFKKRKIILNSDIVHIHDVFIWYLPFKFIYPHKKVYMTFHGWEGKYPIPFLNKFQKKLAANFSNGSITVGSYINKWYGIKSNFVIHGGVEKNKKDKHKKIPNSVVFVGRLEKDTGLLEFLKSLKKFEYNKVTFVGDGSLKKESEKYGVVTGFVDPKLYLSEAEYAVPGGYLSFLEAHSCNCKTITFANNPLKKDYWDEIKKLKKLPTWDEVCDTYLSLWKIK